MTPSPVISLLDKYPHLRLLAARRQADATKHGIGTEKQEVGDGVAVKEGRQAGVGGGERISLLGPGVGRRTPSEDNPVHIVIPANVPRTRVVAEKLFAASVAADDDQWLQFQVEADVPARQQLDQLKLWLVSNRPSTIARSSGVGWIAVKFKDKGKKVLEAKAAWDSHEGEKTMEVVNELATEFHVMGGKWMCHLPSGFIDDVWAKLAISLMCGGLGPSVYMVKVSPVEDIDPSLARGEHVICVYNTDYKDTEQVMRVENLMRSAGVETLLNYKPDIFSALGIYRNNKWGFRPTIYCSRVMLMEGKSRVETVGTGNWYYNSSKGLQYPEVEGSRKVHQDKENNVKLVPDIFNRSDLGKKTKEDRKVLCQQVVPTDTCLPNLVSNNKNKKHVSSKVRLSGANFVLSALTSGLDSFPLESLDKMNSKNMKLMSSKVVLSNNVPISAAPALPTGLDSFPLESLDKMMSKVTVDGKFTIQETNSAGPLNKGNSGQKSSWSHRLAAKKPADIKEINESDDLIDYMKEVKEKVWKEDGKAMDVKDKKQFASSWSHRLAAKHGSSGPITSCEDTVSETGEIGNSRKGKLTRDVTSVANKDGKHIAEVIAKDVEVEDKRPGQLKGDKLSKHTSLKNEHAAGFIPVKKPAWLKKLEELKLKNLDDMKTS
eukprot:GFUD01036411.1.p1 GENE.GFUD01036411.1~~GFUD01036411.1.p1  ORF type:complete len:660 (-),score=226.11 GFUD01036411.1:129-2108(-)